MKQTKGKPRLSLEEKEKIKALVASGTPYKTIAAEMGRDRQTIKRYAKHPEIQAELANFQSKLADEYEDLARRMIDSISDEDIKKINAYQRTLSSGIATDKMRLLRDQATANVGWIGVLKLVEENQEKGKSIEDTE